MSIFFLELYFNDFSAIGFFMFGPTILFLLIGIILFIAKQKKPGKIFLIISGCCLLIAAGLCGIGELI
ncbi:hypothetical protein ACFSQJ_10855 [Croceitalea marina]|uniref:Uncharacterized protein n=1 Tax=Croceitalea marina TaxID=1775166 RepID=A0ABW5MWD2_9FLAO